MEKFLWDESFRIGVDEIDNQHQMLLGYLNECAEQGSNIMDYSYYHVLLNKLKNYADTHFKTEEKLMLSVNYPAYDGHQKQHRLFEEYLAQVNKALIIEENRSVASLTAFLREWYIEHVLNYDKRMGAYILFKT